MPTTVKTTQIHAILDKIVDESSDLPASDESVASPCTDKRKRSLTMSVNERQRVLPSIHLVERKGVEPSTSALRTQECDDVNGTGKELTATPPPVCTNVCTREGGNANAIDDDQLKKDGGAVADPIAAIAAMLMSLSPADRARLAAKLIG